MRIGSDADSNQNFIGALGVESACGDELEALDFYRRRQLVTAFVRLILMQTLEMRFATFVFAKGLLVCPLVRITYISHAFCLITS